ncbi:MAG: ABC transporter permease [Planctomycetes bacterium]|nr:ABC transporter permease [Planctomycetota bacterium]
MATLWQDIRYGLRMLGRNPGFTAVAVVTLALGIGANTAIFTLIDALLLKPLPGVQDPQQLVLVTDNGWASLPYPLYEHLHNSSQSLLGLFASSGVSKRKMKVTGSEEVKAESVWNQPVSGNFFSVLGAPAVLGRMLTANDDRPGAPQPVAVISYDFWRRRFGQDPAVIGKIITLEDVPLTIVGVAPRGFLGFVVGSRPDLWWPIQMVPQVQGWEDALASEGSQWLQIVGRLKPGVAQTQARDELDVIFKRMRLEQADRQRLSDKKRQDFLSHRIELQSAGTGFTWLRRDFLRLLSILMGIVGLVLLVACTNLAGLLLARGTARQREFGVRAALGAGRWALVRQFVAESLLLAAVGGVLGLLLAQWGVRLLANYIPEYGASVLLQLTPDVRILAFTFLVSVGTGLLFGLLPAVRTTRADLATTLKNEAGALLGRASGQLWNKLLVVSQIALTCLLLIGAGLFVRTLQTLKAVDAGLARENLVLFRLDLGREYNASRRAQLHQELLRQLESLPGVRSATLASVLSMGSRGGYFMPNLMTDAVAAKTTRGLHCSGVGVAPNYLQTMGILLLAGRDFGPEDLPTSGAEGRRALRKVILSQSVARSLFGQDNPVGRQLWESGRSESTMEVIGVARDVQHQKLRDKPSTTLFYYVDMEDSDGTFYVRSRGSALSMAGGIRRTVREIAPDVEVTGLRTMEDVVDDQLRQERMLSQLASFFSLSALALACLGLYGILSYAVSRRTREIGIRMALGARRETVILGIMRQGMMLALIGCGLGIILAIGLTRIVSNLLYGVTPTDPLTFAFVSFVLIAVAALASYLPARRAARIDPMVALRYE